MYSTNHLGVFILRRHSLTEVICTLGKNCFRSNSYMLRESIRFIIALHAVRVPLRGKYPCWFSSHCGSSHITSIVFNIERYILHVSVGTPNGLQVLDPFSVQSFKLFVTFGMYTLLKSTSPLKSSAIFSIAFTFFSIHHSGAALYHLGYTLFRCIRVHTLLVNSFLARFQYATGSLLKSFSLMT